MIWGETHIRNEFGGGFGLENKYWMLDIMLELQKTCIYNVVLAN